MRAPGPALVSLARPRPAGHAPSGGTQRRGPSAEGGRGARPSVGGGLETEKRPIRERLMHLLGVRPYRRADLLLRLQQDGLTDGEKEELDQLLLEVGRANANANPNANARFCGMLEGKCLLCSGCPGGPAEQQRPDPGPEGPALL